MVREVIPMKSANFPEINTFGAMMRFAITLEDYCTEMYETAAVVEPFGVMKDAFEELQRQHAKRKGRLEEALRLKLNEVTIEPVSSLKKDDYLIDIGDIKDKSLDEVKELFQKLEEVSAKFYTHSADYSEATAREIMRLFQRMAKDNNKHLKKL